ncbi:MAG: hypothetical protein P8018_13555 [Acidobacteriota bacterium]
MLPRLGPAGAAAVLLLALLLLAAATPGKMKRPARQAPPHGKALLKWTHLTDGLLAPKLEALNAIPVYPKDRAFFTRAQEAIRTRDLTWLDRHLDYPLAVCRNGKVLNIRDKADLKRKFDALFPAGFKKTRLAAGPRTLRMGRLGDRPMGVDFWFLPVPSIVAKGKIHYYIVGIGKQRSCRPGRKGYGSPASDFRVFFIQLKWAARIGDRWWIADHMRFPTYRTGAKKDQVFLKDRAGFLAKYDELWNKTVPAAGGLSPEPSLAERIVHTSTESLLVGGPYGSATAAGIAFNGKVYVSGFPRIESWIFIYRTPNQVSPFHPHFSRKDLFEQFEGGK